MTISNSIPTDAVLIAIDIAKVHNEVLLSYCRPMVCAFEATSSYHRPIARQLGEASFEVWLALARTRDALRNSWDMNDPKIRR